MEFIRENILKIVVFIIALIVVIMVFAFMFGGKKQGSSNSYESIEQKMVDSTKKYINKNQKLYPKGEEVTKVNLDTLENAEYMDKQYAIEDSKVKCTGYVEVQLKNNSYLYTPYLKCGNYYETKTIASYIKDNETIVTSGDGLYKYGEEYVYRGENPNNYLGIGNNLYRIIRIKDNEVELISNKKLSDYIIWDDRYNTEKNQNVGINIYSKSRLKETFEKILKNNEVNKDKAYFSNKEMERMASHDICVGKRATNFGDISMVNECQQVEPNQKISLITVSEFAQASIDQNCRTIFDKSCMNYNYFTKIGKSFRTITAVANNTYEIFYIDEGVAKTSRSSSSFSPNIVIYLDASSLYQSGNGTYEKPYIIR